MDSFHEQLEKFHKGELVLDNDELWRMKYILLGNYHPETHQPIFRPVRTSGICLVNIPIIIGLSFIAPTPLNQVIVQSLNQSLNFVYNFKNANASNVYSKEQLAFSYSMAVGSAVLASLGTLFLIKRLKISESSKLLLNRFAPFIGVASANEVNLFFSRIQDF